MTDAEQTARAFKTAWFSKTARKARIKDDELCEAFREVMKGQADDLGGGVFKKRLKKNMHRSIILAKVANTGFTNTCSQRRIARTSRTTNWRISARSPRAMRP